MYLINQRLEIAGRKIDRSRLNTIKKDEEGDVDEKDVSFSIRSHIIMITL